MTWCSLNINEYIVITCVNVRIIILLPNTMKVFMSLNTFEWIYKLQFLDEQTTHNARFVRLAMYNLLNLLYLLIVL
jgi:hypothetical protein